MRNGNGTMKDKVINTLIVAAIVSAAGWMVAAQVQLSAINKSLDNDFHSKSWAVHVGTLDDMNAMRLELGLPPEGFVDHFSHSAPVMP